MRTFDDIIPPSRRRETEPLSNQIDKKHFQGRSPRFPYATLGVIVLVVAVSIGALFYFSKSIIEITPKTVSVAVSNSFTANQSAGALPYEIVTAQKIASQSVKSSGTRTVNSYASGTITIYNAQSKSQTLIANTRFATASGLIFRIRAAVTVPSGTSTKPGSITAKVYADKTGDQYNVGPTSFTIPGFAGTQQETLVYARSGAAMTGGNSGNVPVVEESVEAGARDSLKNALSLELAESIKTQIPSGYVLLPGAVEIAYQGLTATPSSTTGMVEIKEQGTITAIVFPNGAIANEISKSAGEFGYNGEPIELVDFGSLTLTASGGIPNPDAPSFSFTLNGTARLVYTVDNLRIAAAVSGKTRSAAKVALTNYPEIKRAVIILRPFWRQTFPQDPTSISVVVLDSDQ